MPAESEVRLDAPFEARLVELLEPRDLDLRERLVREVRERRAAPEREPLAKERRRPGRVAVVERVARRVGEPGEAVQVALPAVEVEDVARRPPHDQAGPEGLAELRDVDLH